MAACIGDEQLPGAPHRLGSPRSAFAQAAEEFPQRSPAARSHSLDPSFSKELAHAARGSGVLLPSVPSVPCKYGRKD